MKALCLPEFGPADNFRLQDVEKPAATPGHVLVRVAATSVNPVDYKIRAGRPHMAPPEPRILGMDVAGVIEAVGEGVDGFAPGDEVYGCAGGVKGLPGALAEYMSCDARLIARKPKSLAMREAAALPLVSITAWEALYDRADLQAGQMVLVHAGTGGVGHIGIQLAKARGAEVVASVSSKEKAAIATRLGADTTVDYREESAQDYAARLTGGRGFDVVFDTVGNDNLTNSFVAVRRKGTVVSIQTQKAIDLTPMHQKSLTLHLVLMLLPMLFDEGRERHGRLLQELAALVDACKVKPLLDPRRFTLAEGADAHRHLESGRAVGKVVIDVA